MAVLAATIIPQFTTSANEARQSQLSFNLHALQSQVHLYHLQHNSLFPDVLTKLTVKTDLDSTINVAGVYGPYLVGGVLPDNPKHKKQRGHGLGGWRSKNRWRLALQRGDRPNLGRRVIGSPHGDFVSYTIRPW